MFLLACVTVLWLPMHVSSDPILHEYYAVWKLSYVVVMYKLLIVVFDDLT